MQHQRFKFFIYLYILLASSTHVHTVFAEIMLPVPSSAQNPSKHTTKTFDAKLGGTIGKVDKAGLEINAVYYPYVRYGIKIHAMDGNLVKKSTLKAGMLVSFAVVKQNQSSRISEIWVLKNE